MASEIFCKIAKDLNLHVHEVKEDSSKLLLDIYVDNDTTGETEKEVQRVYNQRSLI